MDVGSIPGQGTKNPHAVGQLRPHITTRENLYAALKTQYSQNLNIYIYIYNLENRKAEKSFACLETKFIKHEIQKSLFFLSFLIY